MRKVKAAVFASGTGSNFQAIMEAGPMPCEIAVLVCDQPEAPVIEKAEAFGVPVFSFRAKNYASKEHYEREIVSRLEELGVEWIFLAGYMRICGPTLLQAYTDRMINIHPSLLPAFPGKDAIGQAFQANVEATGVTVHYVDEGIDTGPIIAQQEVPVMPDDSEGTLKKRIQAVEHQLYPAAIKELILIK
ncbi:phosphoribosylglycinamide formyltransferase [Virgibacillus xinjiangensis]|uniref:Phosphoribosylglycinamide formyltransferase n=1 Tax=Virgibacillus xinjiangensis TaxID=393090 RepID=A0ABV7CSR4_9BACI